MLKWLCGFAIIASAIVSVAYEQHHAREKYEAKREEACIALAITFEQKYSCAKEAQSRKDYTPWWNVLVAWPEGITTWAIIATGFAIAWQSSETRKSAQAAFLNTQALITSERPWLVAYFIRTEETTVPDDGIATFEWEVKNVGRTPAAVKEFAARVVFNIDTEPLPDHPDYGDPDWLFSERILVPGGTLRFQAYWYEWKDGKYRRLCQPDGSQAVDLLVGFGYVKYRDTFDGVREYISGFCDTSTIGGKLLFGNWSQWTDAPAGYAKST
jgi:hypothetical protein